MRRRRPARDLRLAIDCLPLATRKAMLDGIDANRIIVGAYTDRQGGICPMLAAHRNGGRTSLASFAHAWDAYTGARRRPRPASEREILTLRTMLDASIGLDEVPSLAGVPRPRREKLPTGDRRARGGGLGPHRSDVIRARGGGLGPHRSDVFRARELRGQSGWAWLRPYRRLDEYERALSEISALAVAGTDELELGDHAVAGRA